MKRSSVFFASTALSLIFASQPAMAANILVWDGGQGHSGIDNVVTRLTSLGHNVTRTSTVPGDLSAYSTLWAMDFYNGPDAANERAMVTTFLNSDRGVFAQYEWDCCTNSQINWTATLSPLLKSTFSISGSQGVSQDAVAEANEVFGLHTTPNAIPLLQINATANIAAIPAANVVYRLNGTPVVGAYVDPQFVSGDGCLVLSGDIETVFAAPQANQWIENVQYFLQHCIPNPQPICGDGFLANNETCDDGNTNNGDGCSSTCTIEAGWNCVNDTGNTPVTTCTQTCAGAGNSCTAGVGACQQSGTIVCQGSTPVCNAVPGSPTTEACDGIDNDCDGNIDDGFNLGTSCTNGIGACQENGVIVCNGSGGTTCDAVPGAPTTEVCDGIDNDCDGNIDEGFGLGTGCTNGIGACQSSGLVVCDGSGGTTCNAVPGSPTTEVCDGIDNDCDGNIDEGFNLGAACTNGIGACQNAGAIACNGSGGAVCNAIPGSPTTELCDGIDNNCDGTIDEGFNLGTMCSIGVGACISSGVYLCNPQGGASCNAQVIAPTTEVCDGIDNDCDGTTDEGFSLGSACTNGIGACQNSGVLVCNGSGGATCNAIPHQPQPEICNGIDDNCNGSTDEGFNLGTLCVVGVGKCAATGNIICTPNGSATCSATPGTPSTEVCGNPVDEDCDGQLNNGCECLQDSDCGAADSGKVCDVDSGAYKCEDGCRGMDGNGCPDGQHCTSVGPSIGQCHECLNDSHCGALESGIVCSEDNTCVAGCRGVEGNTCPEALVCTSVDNTIGHCEGCVKDANCGMLDSGIICDDTFTCVNGCRGANGNGCPSDAHCTSSDETPGQCLECLADEHCGSTTSGMICTAENLCVEGCRGTGNGCQEGQFCTSTDDSVGQCVACITDENCGSTTSGKVCDANHSCVDGCRGSNGNGCPEGKLCSSIDETIGTCDPTTGGSGGSGGSAGTGATGGSAGTGAVGATGGSAGSGANGGTGATGGSTAGQAGSNGGNAGLGGESGQGGSIGTGATAGNTGNAGTAASGTGNAGQAGAAATNANNTTTIEPEGGCACESAGKNNSMTERFAGAIAALFAGLITLRRRSDKRASLSSREPTGVLFEKYACCFLYPITDTK